MKYKMDSIGRMKDSARSYVDRDFFDDLFVDNSIMLKDLVGVALVPDGLESNWVIDGGVHVHAKLSPTSTDKSLKYRYEFFGEGWRCDFDGIFGRDMKMNKAKSKIVWIADHGEQRNDKGQAARRDLHEWLCSLHR